MAPSVEAAGMPRSRGVDILRQAVHETLPRGRARTEAARKAAADARDKSVALLNQTAHVVGEGINLVVGIPTTKYAEAVGAMVADAGDWTGKELGKVGAYLNEQGELLINGVKTDLRAIRDVAMANVIEPITDEARLIGKAWDKGKYPLVAGGTLIGTAGIWGPRLLQGVGIERTTAVTQSPAAQKAVETAPTVVTAAGEAAKVAPSIPQMIEAIGPQLAQGYADFGPAALIAAGGLGAGYVGVRLAQAYGPEVLALANERLVQPIKTEIAERAIRFYEDHQQQIDFILSLPPAARKAALEKWEQGKAAGVRLARYADARARDFADGLDRAAAGTAALYNDVMSLPADIGAGTFATAAGAVRFGREARALVGTPFIRTGEAIAGIPPREIGRNEAMAAFSQTLDASAAGARAEATRRRERAIQWKVKAGMIK